MNRALKSFHSPAATGIVNSMKHHRPTHQHHHHQHIVNIQRITPRGPLLARGKLALDALMGSFCSISKDTESGGHDGDFGGSHSHAHAKPSQVLDTMPANLETKQPKRRHEFKFQFQDEIASRAKDGAHPSGTEVKEAAANEIMALMREEDEAMLRQNKSSPGGHYLDLRDFLADTRLFHVARMVPKGAHLHLHFNSTLLPGVLLGYAKDMANMYIRSDRQLVEKTDFERCNLEFNLRNLEEVRQEMRVVAIQSNNTAMLKRLGHAESLQGEAAKTRAYDELGPNIFNPRHGHPSTDGKVEEMRYQYFRERWDEAWGSCDEWLIRKLTFSKEEVHSFFAEADDPSPKPEAGIIRKPTRVNSMPAHAASYGLRSRTFDEQEWVIETRQKIMGSNYRRSRESARRAWVAFNGRTKMMKGLFNYETAFRRYTRECLEEFVKDNVQYAEIRPNFMQTNQILDDSAKFKIDNFGTMELIIQEYEKFMKHIGDMSPDGKVIKDKWHRPTFSGIKVIYCTPRSFGREAVAKALDECIEMKKKWPDYIAGFDLVGEEAFAKPHPLRYFEAEFQAFRTQCEAEKLDIPFLFHCGETPDDLEGNLETALKLGSKRIGHGYALPEKPAVLKEMRIKNVCVETCPISNMVLGLVERMDEHSVYRLLEEKMHCAVSSDNGTLFSSTLSHDFYEVMAGHQKINLYGWKQLARWSIEHSCLSTEERNRALVEWEHRWRDFIDALTEAASPGSQLASIPALEKAREKAEARRLVRLTTANSKTSTAI